MVEESGTKLAFPSQTTYLAGMPASMLGRPESHRDRSPVREQGKMSSPDCSPETVSERDRKMEYPPPESALQDRRKE